MNQAEDMGVSDRDTLFLHVAYENCRILLFEKLLRDAINEYITVI